MRQTVAVLAIVLLAAACTPIAAPTVVPGATGGAAVAWPLPADPMGLARKAGLEPETSEHLAYHVHAHIDVFRDGQHLVVPGGIGINIDDPGVTRFDGALGYSYGGIRTPCANPCISPLHTHDPDGVIHTESAAPTPNTFGQFLTEWNVQLPAGAKVYLDGKEYTGDVSAIPLSDGLEIAVVIGTPPSVIPSEFPPGPR